jgi:tetratricopeptide (TPR) repeat protein
LESKIQRKISKNPYKDLSLIKGADDQAIKQAYFKLVKRYSPELFPEEFTRIRTAYDLLRDKKNRASVDLQVINPLMESFGFADCKTEKTSLMKISQQIKEQESQSENNQPSKELIALLKTRSLLLVSLGALDKAKTDWDFLKENTPDDKEVDRNLFRYYFKQGCDQADQDMFEEAIESWQKAYAIDPKDLNLMHNLAQGCSKLHQGDNALGFWRGCMDIWERTLRLKPFDSYIKALVKEASKLLGEFKHVSLPNKAETEEKEEGKESKRQFSNPNKQMGFTCFDEGNYREAIASLERHIGQEPQDQESLLMLGQSYLKYGNTEMPFIIWNRLKRIAPDNKDLIKHIVNGHMEIAKRMMQDGHYPLATVHLKKAMAVDPKNKESIVDLSRIYIAQGEFNLARTVLDKLLKMDPRNRLAKKLQQEIKVRTVGH